jgi:hypothetical protein
MWQRKFINGGKTRKGRQMLMMCVLGCQRLTHVEVKEPIDQHTQNNQRTSINDMTISHEKPKAQPNTFYFIGICIAMQMQSGNWWTVGQMY